MWHRQVSRLRCHTNRAITRQQWETPKNKRSELRSSEKIKRCSENTPLLTELLKKIFTAVEPFFLSPLVDQMTVFGQVSTLTMLQHLFLKYGTIDELDLEENTIKMMGPYNPAETLPD